MKQFLFSLFLVLSMMQNALTADEGPVCKKCQIIREENKHKVNPYPYYDDYLKEHPEAVEMNAVSKKPEVSSKKSEERSQKTE